MTNFTTIWNLPGVFLCPYLITYYSNKLLTHATKSSVSPRGHNKRDFFYYELLMPHKIVVMEWKPVISQYILAMIS